LESLSSFAFNFNLPRYTPDATSSYAYGEGLFAAKAGVPNTIFVQSRKLRQGGSSEQALHQC
jgi:hypothetical protein